jgi:hypothetical protein
VLNCEAEEFLFGETAADKHELELPPNSSNSTTSSPASSPASSSTSINNRGESPPPKKRRRWRETELSHLLETSPFLESKLRSNHTNTNNITNSCSSSSSATSPVISKSTLISPTRQNKQDRVKTKLNFDQVERRKQKVCSHIQNSNMI